MTEVEVIVTKKETLEAALRGEGCLGKAADDEPVFVLRAQDIHSADLVEKWCIWAALGKDISESKLELAKLIVEQMRDWPTRKQPD